jgi:hypothetical protein
MLQRMFNIVMSYSFKSGALIFLVGSAMAGTYLLVLQYGYNLSKLCILGTSLCGLGLGHLLFPGAEPTEEIPWRERASYHKNNASGFARVMWYTMMGGGFAAGFYWMYSLGFI